MGPKSKYEIHLCFISCYTQPGGSFLSFTTFLVCLCYDYNPPGGEFSTCGVASVLGKLRICSILGFRLGIRVAKPAAGVTQQAAFRHGSFRLDMPLWLDSSLLLNAEYDTPQGCTTDFDSFVH